MDPERLNLPFTGFVSFLRARTHAELDTLDADIAVLGVPSDEGSPWYPGARMAPRKIRELSVRYAGYGGSQARSGYFDIDEGRRYLEHEMGNGRIVDAGDVDILYTNVEGTFENITRDVRKVIERGALPVGIGGDHAVTYPIVRAFTEPIHVIHFDAHLDYRPFVHGIQYANGMPIRNISRLPNVGRIIQVGVRSLRTSQDDFNESTARGNDVVTVKGLRRRGMAQVLDSLPPDARVYVSFDIDVLDLPLVPGCASSEPNGLLYDEFKDAFCEIARRCEVVGFDLVEVNPMLDVPSDNTSLLAAQVILEFLGRVVEHPGYRTKHSWRGA